MTRFAFWAMVLLIIAGGTAAYLTYDGTPFQQASKPIAMTQPTTRPDQKEAVAVNPPPPILSPALAAPEEKLAYAPKEGLTIPRPTELPKEASPVPAVPDPVLPLQVKPEQTTAVPAIINAQKQPEPPADPEKVDASKPVETEASSVETATEWEPAVKTGYEAEKQPAPTTSSSDELSSEQVAWGIKASKCLKTRHRDSGCYVTHRREKKQLRIWCPSNAPESVPQECSHEAHMATFQE